MNAPAQLPIYLDYLSTTPVDPRVVEAMTRCLSMEGTFGNPALPFTSVRLEGGRGG